MQTLYLELRESAHEFSSVVYKNLDDCQFSPILTEILHPLEYLWEGLPPPPIVRATVHRHRIHQPHPRNPFLFPAQNLVR